MADHSSQSSGTNWSETRSEDLLSSNWMVGHWSDCSEPFSSEWKRAVGIWSMWSSSPGIGPNACETVRCVAFPVVGSSGLWNSLLTEKSSFLMQQVKTSKFGKDIKH